ncbi:site-2 protease family protein [Campylobacter suis]|uniref:Peptidase M50 domain-containing protein n=1 Tax=Campylobacter suis TaxID=2790657 RepID=A0ABM8Q1C0_9BACT|nr:site-2 protease family protein [Campylobacter suis]CAD7286584.1 hypothetical protein LMG8286_00417 [Campylobacter suis]
MDFTNFDPIFALLLLAALIIAIVGHEIMHGWVAFKFGDSTAKNLGRLSPNPIKHVDPIGTILVPALLYFTTGFCFGWAKPVPVNMSVVLRNGGYKADVFVALAGIFYNIFLAILFLFLLKNFASHFNELSVQFIFLLFSVNLFLGLFNLYPFPPLDGFKAVIYILCMLGLKNLADKLYSAERWGMVVLIVVIISPISQYVFAPIHSVFKLLVTL